MLGMRAEIKTSNAKMSKALQAKLKVQEGGLLKFRAL